jgi:hypothetical protein
MTEANPYYCPLIFQGLYVEKVNTSQVRVSACCLNTPGPVVDNIDFVNDNYLQHQRQLVTQQLPPSGCAECYKIDHNGGFSPRQQALNNFSSAFDTRLRKLDYNVNPICNAKCIQCSSYYSSAWAAEDKIHGITSSRQFNQTLRNTLTDSIDFASINDLYFNGGEPLLSQEPQYILEKIEQAGNLKNLTLSINTNGSIFPREELIDLWKRCRGVRVNFSIDAIGTEFEYIRNPLDWATVSENLQQIAHIDIPRLVVNLTYTMGIHNIDLVQQTHNWFRDQSQHWKIANNFYVHPCSGTLSLEYASKKLRQIWCDLYPDSENLNESDWRRIARRIMQKNTEPADDHLWINHLEMIDQRRGLDWKTSLPALYDAYKKSLG